MLKKYIIEEIKFKFYTVVTMNLKNILLAWGIMINWLSTQANEIKSNTSEKIINTIEINIDQDTSKTKKLVELQQWISWEQLDVLQEDISKIIAQSMIKYFDAEVKAYSFTSEEKKALEKDIETYFSEHKVFTVNGNKIIINLTPSEIERLFKFFMKHFKPKLWWIARIWVGILWENGTCNVVTRHFTKAKWKDAEERYMDIEILVKYVVDGLKAKYPDADMTIWECLSYILNWLPNEHMQNRIRKWSWETYSTAYLNNSISRVKSVRAY